MPRIAIPVPEGTGERRYRNYFETMRALSAKPVELSKEGFDPFEFDGLLLPGGVDVDPARYGQENVACGETDEALDALQLAAVDAFVKAGRPVFGTCRGHQLLNVYFGGTLIQHLPQSPRHKWDDITDEDRSHVACAEPGSWLADIYGETFRVNSAHHQAVDALGRDLIVDQRAEDGVIEAMHHRTLPVYSVQWHPERMCLSRARSDTVDGSKVLEFFLRLCGKETE